MEKIGLTVKINKLKSKNMFIIRATLNWNHLLNIYKLGLFRHHENHSKALVNSIIRHKRYKSHKHLVKINENFNIQNACEVTQKNKVITYNWIGSMIDYGLVKKINKNNWFLTKEGNLIKALLLRIILSH